MNMCLACVGAGVLAFPYAFRCSGMVLGLVFSTLFALQTYYTLEVISAKMTHAFRPAPGQPEEADADTTWIGPRTFEELCRYYLGQWWYIWAMVSIVLGTIGTLIAFLIIVEDLCEPVFFVIFGRGSFWSSRAFIIGFFALFFAFPISSLRDFHSMQWSALAGAITVALVGIVIIWRGVETWVDSGIPRDVSLAQGSVTILLTLPILCFSWSTQLQVVPVYIELEPQQKNLHAMRQIMVFMVAGCSIVYAAIGAFGYGSFGDATRGNVLLNYAVSDNFASAAKIIMAVHVILAYPVNVFPMRRSLRVLFTCNTYRLNEYDWPWWLRAAVAFVVVFFTATIAILVPRVAVVFGLTGAISVMIQFIIPAMLVWTPHPVLEPLTPAVRRQLQQQLRAQASDADRPDAGGEASVDEADAQASVEDAIGDMSLADEAALVAAERNDAELKAAHNARLRAELPWTDRTMTWVQWSLGVFIGITGVVINVYELVNGKIVVPTA